MPKFRPIPALLYNGKDWGKFVAPPFDTVDAQLRKKLLSQSDCNIVALTLPESYQTAARLLQEWLRAGILREREPAFYILEIEHNGKVLEGVIGLAQATPLGTGVHPHEKTFPAPKEDRYKLLEATGVAFSQVVLFYFDPTCQDKSILSKRIPFVDFEFMGMKHRLYVYQGEELADYLSNKELFIADGHHRYETYFRYYLEHPENSKAAWINVFVTNICREGFSILPTHRLIKASPGFEAKLFELVESFFEPGDDIRVVLPQESFGIRLKNNSPLRSKFPSASDAWLSLPQVACDFLLIEGVEANLVCYTKSKEEVYEKVGSEFSAGFLLKAPSVEQIIEISKKGEKMPPKTTYFYPKIPSGIVMYKVK